MKCYVALSLAAAFAVAVTPSHAGKLGKIKICKVEADADITSKEWREAEVVPPGMVYVDMGMTNDDSAPPIRLRVITLQYAVLEGDTKCVTISAAIANNTPRYGTGHFPGAVLGPLITSISPSDNRLLQPQGQGDVSHGPLPGRKMFTWDSDTLPDTRATVVSQMN